MMRKFFSALCILLAVSVRAHAQEEDPTFLAKMRREMLETVVMMEKHNGSTASGVIVYSAMRDGVVHTYALTNFHVIMPHLKFAASGNGTKKTRTKKEEKTAQHLNEIGRTPLIAAVFRYGDRIQDVVRQFQKADIIAYDAEEDLAVVRITAAAGVLPRAALAPKDVKLVPFATVWSVGSAGHHFPFPVKGVVGGMDFRSGKTDVEDGTDMLTTAPIAPGNSGGPVFGYSRACGCYEVISITYSSEQDEDVKGGTIPHMAYSVPVWKIHDFLGKNGLGFISETQNSH